MYSLYDYLSTPFVYLTQSLWRDEAFSFVLSKNNFIDIIRFTSQDFNPPLYYLMLHYWMILFGNSEVSLRSLSLIFHILTSYVVYKFASKVINQRAGFFAFFLTFFNPMLLYFSMEARMYSLLAFVSVASMYFFYLKRWGWWFAFCILGIYTHLFFWFIILAQLLFSFLIKDYKKYLLRFSMLLLVFLPWIPFVLSQMLKGSQGFWINRIDVQLLMSSIGNIFTSYEGTPGGLWNFTALISIGVLFLSFVILKKKNDLFTKLNLIWLYIPLFVIIIVSLWKPLFVNRYLIFLVIPMIFILVRCVELLKRGRTIVYISLIILETTVFLFFGPYYRKLDIRETVRRISMQMKEGDVIVSNTPLTYFETNYYSGFKSFLYAPDKNSIPSYVGRALIDERKIVPDFNNFKSSVFIINDDGTVRIKKAPLL